MRYTNLLLTYLLTYLLCDCALYKLFMITITITSKIKRLTRNLFARSVELLSSARLHVILTAVKFNFSVVFGVSFGAGTEFIYTISLYI